MTTCIELLCFSNAELSVEGYWQRVSSCRDLVIKCRVVSGVVTTTCLELLDLFHAELSPMEVLPTCIELLE